MAVNSLAPRLHDVIVEPFFTDPAQPVQRPPPAAGPPLASSPDVEDDLQSEDVEKDLQSEVASLRHELALARRDADPELMQVLCLCNGAAAMQLRLIEQACGCTVITV